MYARKMLFHSPIICMNSIVKPSAGSSEEKIMDRRYFLKQTVAFYTAYSFFGRPSSGQTFEEKRAKIKTSLNLYSFNRALLDGTISLEEVLEFASETGFDAVDITGYYLPGYPAPPALDIINKVKRHAFLLGLSISGTGVRNDFTVADVEKRTADRKLVRRWVQVASDLGAPMLRVFAGRRQLTGSEWNETAKWVADCLHQCGDYGRESGVMIGLQNHAEFLKTADQVLRLLEMADSEWVGLMLDIGSFPTAIPYADIERTVHKAISWQVKENIKTAQGEEKTDLTRIIRIAKDAGYRGFMPLETLGAGDPKVKVKALLTEFRDAMA
jgi:sugar phosphate isomerase/epimerase